MLSGVSATCSYYSVVGGSGCVVRDCARFVKLTLLQNSQPPVTTIYDPPFTIYFLYVTIFSVNLEWISNYLTSLCILTIFQCCDPYPFFPLPFLGQLNILLYHGRLAVSCHLRLSFLKCQIVGAKPSHSSTMPYTFMGARQIHIIPSRITPLQPRTIPSIFPCLPHSTPHHLHGS